LAENSLIKEIKDEKVTKSLETLFKITRLIQNRVMSLRMVPIKDTFDKMKRVFRDSTKKVQKEVELEIIGEDTEIDKTVVDSLSDPLIHIIRNAVDHGIEATAEDRAQAGKSKVAKVVLSAYHKGGNIAIEIRDDGRGVNRDKVLKKALERGLAQDDVEYTDSEVFNFIMMAGFSTADVISDISGRGVGLDVVATSIEKLSGKVEIESTQGKGTTFRILLPLTLAIIDGMLVKSSDETFIIPILSIIESFRPSREIVHTVKNKGEFVNLRGELLPVIRLSEKLELDDEHPNIWDSTLVCVENEKGKFTILIDDLIGRQQVVIKPLSKALSKLKEISGGAVMGNGEIALILNVESLY
jgi:two-component system chemotaxis sensor kinase CheA